MIKIYILFLLLVASTIFISNKGLATQHSRYIDLEFSEGDARKVFASAPTLEKKWAAYQDLVCFQPLDIDTIEYDLGELFSAQIPPEPTLLEANHEDAFKKTFQLYSRAYSLSKSKEIHSKLFEMFKRFLLHRAEMYQNVVQEALKAKQDLQKEKIRGLSSLSLSPPSSSPSLSPEPEMPCWLSPPSPAPSLSPSPEPETRFLNALSMVKDIPEVFKFGFIQYKHHLEEMHPERVSHFLRELVEKQEDLHPYVFNEYIENQDIDTKAYFDKKSVADIYKWLYTQYTDTDFSLGPEIMRFLSFCTANKYFNEIKEFLEELNIVDHVSLEEQAQAYARFLLVCTYLNLKEHDKALDVFAKILPFINLIDEKLQRSILDNVLCHVNTAERIVKILPFVHIVPEIWQEEVEKFFSFAKVSRKKKQREAYVNCIKRALEEAKKEEKDKIKNEQPKICLSSFLPSSSSSSSFSSLPSSSSSSLLGQYSENGKEGKLPTRKQKIKTRNPSNLNMKADKKSTSKNENIEETTSLGFNVKARLGKSAYETLKEIFRAYVREVRPSALKITREDVKTLFENLNQKFSSSRGKGGHSIGILNNEEKLSENGKRKVLTLGSKTYLTPAAIIDIADTLLGFGIYPQEYEDALKDKELL